MKRLLAAAALLSTAACSTAMPGAPAAAHAPGVVPAPAEEEAILQVIDTFLIAVGNGDRALQASVQLPDGGLAISRSRDGAPGAVRRMPASDFQKPTPDHDPFVEMYWAPDIRVRGSFAQVWTPYVLRDNGAVVHCGINAFQLVKLEGGWKINSALSSMEPGACDELGAATATGLRPHEGWRETRNE